MRSESRKIYTLTLLLEPSFQDAAGNQNDASNTFTFTYDSTAPTVQISSQNCGQDSTTNESPCEIDFIVSESSTDFETSASIQVSGGTLGTISGSDGIFTSTLTPSSDGTIQVYVSANTFEDEAGNRNAANSETLSFTYVSVLTSTTSNTNTNTSNIGTILLFRR